MVDRGKERQILVRPNRPVSEMSRAELIELGGALYDAINAEKPARDENEPSR